MAKFLGEDFSSELIEEIKKCKTSIIIISPYITKLAVEKITYSLPRKKVDLMVITRPPGPEYINGSIDIEALLLL